MMRDGRRNIDEFVVRPAAAWGEARDYVEKDQKDKLKQILLEEFDAGNIRILWDSTGCKCVSGGFISFSNTTVYNDLTLYTLPTAF